jgi:hypothetical protein
VQSIGQFRVFTCDRLGEGLVVDSSWRFKGLEAEVVILCGFPESHPGNEILYVGTSRAKTFLSIVGSPTVFDYLNTASD